MSWGWRVSGVARRAAVAGVAVTVLGSVGLLPAAAVTGSVTPKPSGSASTTALPVPQATVDAQRSVGGPRLASMGLITDLPPGVPAPPVLRDVSWVLADLDSGEVIAAKAPHARMLPASTLKTLTALTLIPQVPATARIVATAGDANADGTRVGMVPGLPYTGANLFQALLMSSGNDAAYALARAGGGREATLARMNERAAYLGAHDTLAKDPAGLDAAGETSSAYDLALIGRAALQLEDFRRYVTTKQVDFPGRVDPKTKKRATYKINNHNKLLYNYPGTIGVKNGYTEAAHRTYISAVTRGGKTYLLTEMYGLDTSWRPQAAMYDWAFKYGDRANPVGRLVDPGEVTTAPQQGSAADPNVAAPADGARGSHNPAAAALPMASLLDRSVPPWTGAVGLAASLLLVLVLSRRGRRRAAHRPRH